MTQRLKTVLLKSAMIITAVSVIGIPSFYHHCLLRGHHNWQTGFIPDAHNHCVCCEDVENEYIYICSEPSTSCCDNDSQHYQYETAVTHTTCCTIKMISLYIIATEYFPKPQLKQILASISLFDTPFQYILNKILPVLHFPLPLPYPDFSPPRTAIFLFTQFLL